MAVTRPPSSPRMAAVASPPSQTIGRRQGRNIGSHLPPPGWDELPPTPRGAQHLITPVDSVLRLVIIFLLALSIGLERQVHRKPVGFGTFTFVGLGSCILAIIAVDLSEAEPLPLLGGIITGIGFLGAGALIRHQDRVFGFTTAALIWAMAAMGISSGTGHLIITLVLYSLVWTIILVDRHLESRGWGSHSKVITLTVSNPLELADLVTFARMKDVHYDRYELDKDQGLVRVTMQVRLRPSEVAPLLQALQANDKVRYVQLE